MTWPQRCDVGAIDKRLSALQDAIIAVLERQAPALNANSARTTFRMKRSIKDNQYFGGRLRATREYATMTVSSIGATALRIYPQHTNPASIAGPGFAQSLAVATGPDAGTNISSGATPGAGTSVAEPTPDFTNMTPHQLYSTAQTMYNQGKIGLDELFNMQMMSGEFQTNGVSTGNETPVDFVAAFKETRAFNATHGGWGANGYDPYTAILNAIGAGGQGGIA